MRNRLIERWMLLLLVMLLTACHSDDKEEIVIPEDEDCYLDIYVYAPDRPIVTRGDVGNIKATDAESTVHSLQIWVFKNSNGSLVGYLDTRDDDISEPFVLNEKGQQVYRMKVDKAFANAPEAVDVYVVANAASCGLTALGKTTSRADLNGAMIKKINDVDYFGTSPRVSSVPADGLPMSAVLKKQPISGKFPTLRIGTESQIATLHLTRAVSKLRFVLCRVKDESPTKKLESIDEIQLNSGVKNTSCQIPTETYLMPGSHSYTNNYVSGGITYVTETSPLYPTAIPTVVNPQVYAYDTQKAQDYENLIDAAVERNLTNLTWLKTYGVDNHVPELAALEEIDLPQLKELGLTYLRESDKQLKGTIKYTYSQSGVNQPQATATFLMAAPGDFLRNHSWIIYIYYLDSKIYTLTVTNIGMRQWETDPLVENKEVYNW